MIEFKARVLLELGAELISSDAVALYELVKNGIDAGSDKIEIEIQVVLQPSAYRQLVHHWFNPKTPWDKDAFLEAVEEALEGQADGTLQEEFLDRMGKARDRDHAATLLAKAFFDFNYVAVRDQGCGMTTKDLKSCYLTIGTPMRLHERQKTLADPHADSDRLPLGEKGIGRLAAMRIGHHVVVRTGFNGEKVWNQLTLDWRPLFNDPDLDASALRFSPKATDDAKPSRTTGTTIVIRDLQSDWTDKKIEELGRTEFAKLRDPFEGDYANQFLQVKWQGKLRQDILKFSSSKLKEADAKCTISFRSGTGDTTDRERGPLLKVSTEYRTFNKAESVTHEGAHLRNCVSYPPTGKRRPKAQDKLAGSDEVINALETLGDFDAEFHWFNRGRFMREQSHLWETGLKQFVRAWSGGLLVYRDGYRVYPYGSPEDDWLDLDRKALSSGAYKLNRAQIVGYLRISSAKNPRLQDQTNREGFRDCPEREALKRLLRQAIVSDCKTFLESVDRSSKPADEETIRKITKRIDTNQKSAVVSLRQLSSRVPAESETVNKVIAQLQEVEEAWGRAKEALIAHEGEIEQYVHLAGVGLMVEVIAHELSRATQSMLELLGKKSLATNPGQLKALEAQIKTLSKRIRILDELSIPGRQIRAIHDLSDLVALVADLYAAKAERHGVTIKIKPVGQGKLKHKVERGQILQILDNLLNNAFYWLARRLDRSKPPRIDIEIDADDREIRITDNGPGIPVSTGVKVFDAFYTTKPAGEGRGLGLHIARRLAEENTAKLDLLDHDGKDHHGFVLRFEE